MPTQLPRFQVTQTPDVERALSLAAQEWPKAKRPELIAHLLEEGAAAIESRREAAHAQRRRVLRETAGTFSYPSGHLDELRAEWPE